MGKIQQIEELALSLARHEGVGACAVASRLGQGDILYDSNPGEIDQALLSTLISSLLLIGEKLGHELGGIRIDYQLANYGASTAIIVPGGENVALLVLVKGTGDLEGIIAAAREASRKIDELVRNRVAGG